MNDVGDSPFELRFDPRTIKHLGVRMYSTLPPALAELVANAYDADAENVKITLTEADGTPSEIIIEDDGSGLSFSEINEKFLIIGRNRRETDGDQPSPKFKRKPIGKKGLGKLALFGVARTIVIQTVKAGKLNEFLLDWDELLSSEGSYRPHPNQIDKNSPSKNGTTIRLLNLRRKTPFDPEPLADSLSRYFLFDKTFTVELHSPSGDTLMINNERKFKSLNIEFQWDVESEDIIPTTSEYHGKISGCLMTTEKPIPPSFRLRGITLFSRGKLVNAPEFFSTSESSHFYQYLTGWLTVDFIDDLSEDVISTNRQSLDWDNEEMTKLRDFLSGVISGISVSWRRKRKENKISDLERKTGIDTQTWIATMPDDVGEKTNEILEALRGEDALERFTPVVKALHYIVPEYPRLHWRHLHPEIQEVSKDDYFRADYYRAFIEAMKRYIANVRSKSGSNNNSDQSMMGEVFGSVQRRTLSVAGHYRRPDGSAFSGQTLENIEEGQKLLSMGVVSGGRNPLSHEEIAHIKDSGLFSESDCLDALSILSHLMRRLDSSR